MKIIMNDFSKNRNIKTWMRRIGFAKQAKKIEKSCENIATFSSNISLDAKSNEMKTN